MNPQTCKLELTVQQLNTIMTALGELPFKVSNDIVQEIVKQFNEQQPKQDAANE
jgi:hypothetical protein